MESLISVIVPIYKVEEYLDRCLESIVNQSYKNLEIILVDDGSPDSCPKICDEWAKKDIRIKVIHKENGGLSDARNAGLSIAQGEYISFIDSDDWINIHFFEVMFNTMTAEKSDIIQCEKLDTTKNNGEYLQQVDTFNLTTVTDEQAISMLICENKFKQVVWNKLYKKQIIVKPFVKGVINEDEFWTYKIISEADRITYIDAKLYYYFSRPGSIMGKGYSLKRLDGLMALIERHNYICEQYPSLKDISNNSVYGACMFHYQMIVKNIKDRNKTNYLRRIKNIAKKYYPSIKTIDNKKYRIWIMLSKHMFGIICRIRAVLGIGF